MGNWQMWLGLFDKHINKKHPQEKVAKTVGKAISAGLTDKSVAQIEFFAIPDSDTKISADSYEFYDDARNQWSMIITIYTNTYDQLQ
jgi:hypothetical protein